MRQTRQRSRAKQVERVVPPPPPPPTVVAPAEPAALVLARSHLWCVVALLILTVAAFQPALRAGFLRWDDTLYVSANRLLQSGGDGLTQIWNPFADRLPQYYPVVFTSYWLEYQLWQLAPAGYHATNVALHALNAVLVLLLARALGASMWVATGAAAVFAVHPVQVESVAWVTERKNTLSTAWYASAFLLYLRYRRNGRWTVYAGSVLSFAAALLSKSQTVSLPLMLAFTDWQLQRTGRLRRTPRARVVVRLAPFIVLALLAAALTAYVERRNTVSPTELPTLSQRLLIAPNAPWFYVATFLAPSPAPIYPKWDVTPSNPSWWIGAVACVAASVLLLRLGSRIGPLPFWGLVQFFVSLGPVLGILPFALQQYTYVADHFLYLSCIGGGIALCALAERLAGAPAQTLRWRLVTGAGALVLAAYALHTFRLSTYWENNFSFWVYAESRNPNSYPPNINLGLHHEAQRQWSDALPYYQRAYELRPWDEFAFTHYLGALDVVRGPQAVVTACNAELQRSGAKLYVPYFHRAIALEALGRRSDALADYDRVLSLTRSGSNTWRTSRAARDRLAPPSP